MATGRATAALRLARAVRLANLPRGPLTDEECRQHTAAIHGFLLGDIGNSGRRRDAGGWLFSLGQRPHPWTETQIRYLQARVTEVLGALTGDGPSAHLPLQGLTLSLKRRPDYEAHGNGMVEIGGAGGRSAREHPSLAGFLAILCIEAATVDSRIVGACSAHRSGSTTELCGRLFVRKRSNKNYCSPQCFKRAGQRRLRATAAGKPKPTRGASSRPAPRRRGPTTR
jgi:hypothetical protein